MERKVNLDRMIAKEFAQLPPEQAQESFVQRRIEFLEEMLEEFGVLQEAYAEENHFDGRASTGRLVEQLESELAAARKGWDAHSAWLKDWSEKMGR